MKKILVAEDDRLISDSLVENLKEHGFEVYPTYDGEEALKKVAEVKPDLVLLDVMMPKMDGISVMWELQASPETKNIPTIILTNMSDMETVSKIMEAGGTDYLLKSEQSIDQVVAKVKEVLSRHS